MSNGLRIWNSSGQLTLDISERLARYHATITLSSIGPSQTVTIPVAGYNTDGSWFPIYRNPELFQQLKMTEVSGGLSFRNLSAYYTAQAGGIIDIFRG